MAKRTKAKKPIKGPISYKAGEGLMVSTRAEVPRTADEKVTVAKSIVQAALAAYDSGVLEDKNYDIHWPLSMAIEILERALVQMESNYGEGMVHGT